MGFMLVLFTSKKWHTLQCAAISATAELLFDQDQFSYEVLSNSLKFP